MLVFENVTELNLAQTLDCGQSFRWTENSDGSFSGVAFGQSVTVRPDGGRLLLAGAEESDRERWRRYFDLETDYAAIRADISARHPVLREAAAYAGGIRILRQEPYEALCTFIISQNNNIKRIKGIVQRLCECCGKRLADGSYAFPDADVMSRLSAEDLAPLRAGFRTRYLLDAAKKVSAGDVDLDMCYTAPYEEARAELMKITGVGVKVDDIGNKLTLGIQYAAAPMLAQNFGPQVGAPVRALHSNTFFITAVCIPKFLLRIIIS